MALFERDIVNITGIHTVKRYCMEQELPEGSRRFSTELKTNELIFYVSGGGKAHFCGVDLVDEPGSLRFLPKGKNKGEYLVSHGQPGVCYDIYFDSDAPISSKAVGLRNMEHLAPKFEKIYRIWSEKKPGWYAAAMSVLYEIIRTLQESGYVPEARRQRMEPARAYVLQHFGDGDFDYNALCGVTGLSYSAFSREFHAVFHTNPVKFLTRTRMEHAKELLVTGRYSVTQTAELCGFQNVYYFSNVFKREVGVSPRKYK